MRAKNRFEAARRQFRDFGGVIPKSDFFYSCSKLLLIHFKPDKRSKEGKNFHLKGDKRHSLGGKKFTTIDPTDTKDHVQTNTRWGDARPPHLDFLQ
jgi:hypothetical protein